MSFHLMHLQIHLRRKDHSNNLILKKVHRKVLKRGKIEIASKLTLKNKKII